MFESKTIGRGLSVTAGLTLAYLINRVQKERLPADILGYSLKTSACFFLGQRAIEKNDEFVARSMMGFWAYETLRVLPIGKPPKASVVLQPTAQNVPKQGEPTQDGQTPTSGYDTFQPDVPIINPAFSNAQVLSSVMTPENMEMAGVALKGVASILSGFMGRGEN